jgi:MFS family permease
LQANIRTNALHGVMSVMALNMVQPFIGIFAVKLNATNYQIALLSSAPAVVSLAAMIPGARLVDRFPRKQRITMVFLLAHRAFFLALACVPFFTPDRRAAMLVAFVALMNLPGAIGNVAWQSFISGIIPQQLRPAAFAMRSRWMNLAGTVVVLAAGRMLDLVAYPLGYQVAFVLAFGLAVLEIWVFSRIDEAWVDHMQGVSPVEGAPAAAATAAAGSPVASASPESPGGGRSGPLATLRRTWSEIYRQKPFLRYTAASIYFYLAWQTAWPLFTLYQVRVLGANNLWVSLLNLANTGGSLVGYSFWARYANRHGNLRTLFAASAGIFIVPTVYAFSHSLYTVAVFNLLTGAVFSGVALSLFNALLDVTPEHHRTSYIAYYNTSVNVSAILAPVFGVALLNRFGFMWAFLAAAFLRITGSLAFLLVDRIEARDRGNLAQSTARAGTIQAN